MSQDRSKSERGWSVLESTIALALLSISLVGVGGVLVSCITTVALNREIAMAMDAARSFVEPLQTTNLFPLLFRLYNDDPADDPPGMPGPGSKFVVRGLRGPSGDPLEAAGEIIFPTGGTTNQLREDVHDPALGMPRDLNGDGRIDGLSHAQDYRILPVTIRIRWKGAVGVRTAVYRTLLSGRGS